MKPATRLIHLADGVNADAAPLTTPIYETSTYVFESAQEVRDYNEGTLDEVPVLALREPDSAWRSRRRSPRSRGRRPRSCSSSGQAATTTALLAMLAAGDEIVCSARDLRRHAAPPRGPAAEVRYPAAIRDDRRAAPARLGLLGAQRRWSGSSRRSIQRCAVSTSPRWPRPVAARGVMSVDRQHVCQPDQSATAVARRRRRDAQRDQVPQRAQRRHGRRARRTDRRHREDTQGAQARRRRPRSVRCLRARPRD